MNLRSQMIFVALFLVIVYLSGCSSTPDPVATPDEQMVALEGGDLPLAPLDIDITFREAKPEDALILQDIHFDYDKSEIKGSEKGLLENIYTWLLEHPETTLMIEGHCDERGTLEYNLALGERRGLSIRTYLTGLGINPDRLHTISYGEEQPLCPESNEECWAKNRRGHFLVDYGEGGGEEIVYEEMIE